MNLIDLPEPTPRSTAEIIAENMLAGLNATLSQRIDDHRKSFRAFWNSPATPDEILAAMGANAGKLLAAAGENVEHIATLAAIAGKTLHDFLAPENYVPRRAITIAEDGTGTLAEPAPGFDAWGRPIPEPEPEDPV
jgi:hypothetical protein